VVWLKGEGTPEVHRKMDLSKHVLFESVRLVGAVGVGLKAVLIPCKLLILRTARMAQIPKFAETRYTAGTRSEADGPPG
jgi:hypothetical protein